MPMFYRDEHGIGGAHTTTVIERDKVPLLYTADGRPLTKSSRIGFRVNGNQGPNDH